MAGFDTITIEEATDRLIDYRGRTPPKTESGVRLITAKVVKGGQILEEPKEFIAAAFYDEWMRRGLPQKHDVLLTTEAPLGEVAVLRDAERIALAQRIILLRAKAGRVDPLFLFYALQSDFGQGELRARGTGTTVLGIKQSELRQVRIPVFSLPAQQRIAGILSAYDELIENSQRRIRILETMARALYREWFVHFRFPGHENVPLVASTLGHIPKGWDVLDLDRLKADQPHAINGGPFGSKLVTRDYVEAGVPVIRGSNLSESGRFDPTGFVFVTEEKADELRANLARPGDIVVTQRGTLGQIGMIPPGIGHARFVISQSQMKITLDPAAINREYAFFFLRSEEAQQRIRNLASSSGVPHINLATLREFQILLPPRDLQERFGGFALQTETTIEQLTRQIANLRRTRHLLLPRLLSGDVRLGAAAT